VTSLGMAVLVLMVGLQDPNGWGISPEWAASYPQTAQEIADAAEESPLLRDVEATAALLVIMGYRESRFDRWAEGDAGAAVGLFQVHRAWGDETARGALRLLHESFRVCRERPLTERLGWYAAGGKGCDRRLELSRSRMAEVAKILPKLRAELRAVR